MLRKVSILVFGLIVASLFFRCSDDFDKNDNGMMFGKKSQRQVHYLSGDKTQEVLKKFEIAASTSKKMKLFTKSGASQRSNVGTIDYSTIMQVIDTIGNVNYTFRILNHPEDDENTFHNLVLKELVEEEFKILLIKYQHFDANYKFNENTTFKSVNLTSTEPCNNEPIPISGGGGGGGTYDPGIPNPGSGGSSGSGTYNPSDSPSCWETLYIRCCHNTEYHYGNNSSCTCPEGERGATIIYNTCDTTRPPTFIIGRNTNIDPCNPDGEVGVLVPIVSTPCGELNKFNNNNAIQQTLRILKEQSSGTTEHGNYISETTNTAGATYLSFPVIPQNPNNPFEVDFRPGLATGKVKGAMHCHTDPETTRMFPMFSASDLAALYIIADAHVPANNTTKNYVEYTVMLSVGSGHYALKLKNFSGDYNAKFNANILDFRDDLEIENLKIGHLADSNLLTETFLKNLNKYFGDEVGLYKATEGADPNGLPIVNGWKEQTLNENGDIVEIDCQ